MAAVTTTATRYNVNGSMREQYYTINTSGSAGDTLVVGINEVVMVVFTLDSTVTSYSVASNGPGAGSTITLQTNGAQTGLLVAVTGH